MPNNETNEIKMNERIEAEAPGVQATLDRAYSGYTLLVHRENDDGTCATDCTIVHDEDGHMHREAIQLLCEWMYKGDPPELSAELLVLVTGAAMKDAVAGTRGYKQRLALAAAAQACLDDLNQPARFAQASDFVRSLIEAHAPQYIKEMALGEWERTVKQIRQLLVGEAPADEQAAPQTQPPPPPEWVADLRKQWAAEEATKKQTEDEIAKRVEKSPLALNAAHPIDGDDPIAAEERALTAGTIEAASSQPASDDDYPF